MKTINGLNSGPLQTFRVPLDNGEIIKFTINYRPAVQMWFLALEYNTFIVKGLRIVKSLNMLSQYMNIIPFGLYVEIGDQSEPLLINDFASQRVKLNLLDETEVDSLQNFYQELNI